MLWYKAWLETRSRFLISLVGIVVICCLAVFLQEWHYRAPYTAYYYFVFHSTYQSLAALWVMAVTLLMMGGLVREKAVGASSFTLALPVNRARLMRARIGMGVILAIVLGIVPLTAMFVVACVTGKTLAIAQAGTCLVLLFGAGITFFAIAVLAASLFEGEYTAPLIAYGTLFVLMLVFSSPALREYSLWHLLFGSNLLDRKTQLLVGPVPWVQIMVSGAVAALLLIFSVKIVERREF